MKNSIKFFSCAWHWFNKSLVFCTPFVDLFVRFYVAKQFFMSGLTKIDNWQTTVFLFTHEYHVPLLSPTFAAFLGTVTELTMPVLLLLGLLGRVPAFVLFIFNIIAVISYPFLLTEAGTAGFNDHFHWGVLLLILMVHGSGCFTMDNGIKYLYGKVKGEA